MTDHQPDPEKCIQSPGLNPSTSATSDDKSGAPSSDKNDGDVFNNINNNTTTTPGIKTIDEEAPQYQLGEGSSSGATSNVKKKVKKTKKKKAETVKGVSNNVNNNNNNAASNDGEAASCSSSSTAAAVSFDPPPLPLFCKKCLGRNIGKKGERSDAYVITCAKCGAHEVLMKPGGDGVLKISDPASQNLPKGDLMEAAWKSAGEKIDSVLKIDEEDYIKKEERLMSSRITVFGQRLQNCSRECADLYPLIITLRSLQLKKTSSTPHQRKNLETEIKNRLFSLEDNIHEIESFEMKYLRKPPGARTGLGANTTPQATAVTTTATPLAPSTTATKKKKGSSTKSTTSPEIKETTFQTNYSLFDTSPPLTATSPTGAAPSTSGNEETHALLSRQATGGATAMGTTCTFDSAGNMSLKTKSSLWYIERVEKLNAFLEVMHGHLTRYCLMQTALIQNRTEEAIAKTRRKETEVIESLHDFTLGMVDQCKGTTLSCMQKMESKKKDLRRKEKLLVEARILAEQCMINGDEEQLRQIEEMLRHLRLQN